MTNVTPQQDSTPADRPDDQPSDEPDENLSRREAKYRTQLRAAEAERDQLATKLAAVQTDQVNAAIVAAGLKPQAIWSVTNLDDVIADDGTVNTEAVQQACQRARTELGIEPSKPKPARGLHSGAMRPQPPTDKWREAFAPRER